MPTKRKRRAHGSTLAREAWLLLSIGAGMNSCPDAQVRATWREWGPAAEARGRREYGEVWRPFVGLIAAAEGWDRAD